MTIVNTDGYIEEGKSKALKHKQFKLRGLGIPPIEFTPTGKPQVSASVLRKLAGTPDATPPKWGTAWNHFGK
jgi:DNA polymerase-1